MIDLVKNNIPLIIDICQRHYVKTLYVFGSATNEASFKVDSDIDFLYEIDTEKFTDWSRNYDYVDNLQSLENSLQDLLKRKIDLVPDTIISNKYLKKTIEESKQQLYAA